MPSALLDSSRPKVVGSIGDAGSLGSADPELAQTECDLIEIRLDLLDPDTLAARPWRKFGDFPLLFTARCEKEGGAPGLDTAERVARLRAVLDEAALVDIELASATEMEPLIEELQQRDIPWLASFHDFHGVPAVAELAARRQAAKHAGAAGFKAAVSLDWRMDQLGPLATFLTTGHGYPVSLMGMGPLAPVSRVLFAQLGSVLNYGYLGSSPTAPGQWSARQLKEAIESVETGG